MLAKNDKLTEDEMLETFLKDLKKLKRASILKNIGSCIAALGVVAPALMVAVRYFGGQDNKGFKVKEDVERKLAEDLKNGKTIAV